MSQTVRILIVSAVGAIALCLLAGCGPSRAPAGVYSVGQRVVAPSAAPPLTATQAAQANPGFPIFLIEVDNLTSRELALQVDGVWSTSPYRITSNFSSLTGQNRALVRANSSDFFYAGAVPLEIVVLGEPASGSPALFGPVHYVLGVDYTAQSTGVRVRLP